MLKKALLACGVVSSALYVVNNVVLAAQWENYSFADRTISELAAIGAPSRALADPLFTAYTALLLAFGVGVWASAGEQRALRVTGALTIAVGIIGLFLPPMHVREALARGEGSLTDTMHVTLGGVNSVLIIVAIGFGATAFGKTFRLYSIATILVMLVFGAFTGIQAPGVEANRPTPGIGIVERISFGAWLLWFAVLSIALLRSPVPRGGRLPRLGSEGAGGQ